MVMRKGNMDSSLLCPARQHDPQGSTVDANDERKKWWEDIPKGADAIVKQIAAERVLVDLLNGRLDGPKPVADSCSCCSSSSSSSSSSSNNRNLNRNKEPNHPNQVVDFEAVCQLVQEYPAICHQTYTFEWDHGDTRTLTPLAMLCCLKCPLKLVQLVYDAYPKAITLEEPRKGCLPFHYACTFEASTDVLDFLMAQHPASIQTPRHDGMYPLHLAIYFKAPIHIVKHLYNSWTQALTQCDYDQWTAIHAAARGQASLEVVQYLASLHPDSCGAIDAKGRSPLHLACRKRNNLPVVDFLIRQAPQTMLLEDATASTPLFCAARNQTVPVLELLLRHHPQPPFDAPTNPNPGDGILRDHVGATLLHYAALENTSDVVDFLVTRHPNTVTCRTLDYCRYMPLHLACHFRAPLDNIKVLVQAAPRTLQATCRRGRTPLDICLLYNNNKHKPQVISYLKEQMDNLD